MKTYDHFTQQDHAIYAEAVEKGAEWLDEVHPGWAEEVSGELLNLSMRSTSSDVLALIFAGGFSAGLDYLADWTGARGIISTRGELAMEYGFDIAGRELNEPGTEEAAYALLTAMWADQVYNRIAED